jgi:hypothetical protein
VVVGGIICYQVQGSVQNKYDPTFNFSQKGNLAGITFSIRLGFHVGEVILGDIPNLIYCKLPAS